MRLLIDLKQDCHGDIVGRIDTSSDSKFVLEAFACAVEHFSKVCGVPAPEIVNDIGRLVK